MRVELSKTTYTNFVLRFLKEENLLGELRYEVTKGLRDLDNIIEVAYNHNRDGFIDEAFLWETTRRGHKFWKEVNRKFGQKIIELNSYMMNIATKETVKEEKKILIDYLNDKNLYNNFLLNFSNYNGWFASVNTNHVSCGIRTIDEFLAAMHKSGRAFRDLFNYAFNWIKTEEGTNFWQEVYHDFRIYHIGKEKNTVKYI